MLKLKALREKKQAEQKAASEAQKDQDGHKNEKEEQSVFTLKKQSASGRRGRANAAMLRVQKDMSSMDEPIPGAELVVPDPDDIMHFNILIKPTDGLYKGATFKFTVEIPNSYPYDPPKVRCTTLVYHPNIDWEGHVCLNILREEWKPVLSIGSVMFGLMTLFLEPNPDDPLNKEAAKLMLDHPREFERNVKSTLRGGYHFGRQFEKLL